MALDDVVVLNVDTNTLETPYDDLQSLPNDVVRSYCPAFNKGVNIHRFKKKKTTVLTTSCLTGFIFKKSSEEGFHDHRGRCSSSLPQESGGSVRQLQERSADRVGQYRREGGGEQRKMEF